MKAKIGRLVDVAGITAAVWTLLVSAKIILNQFQFYRVSFDQCDAEKNAMVFGLLAMWLLLLIARAFGINRKRLIILTTVFAIVASSSIPTY